VPAGDTTRRAYTYLVAGSLGVGLASGFKAIAVSFFSKNKKQQLILCLCVEKKLFFLFLFNYRKAILSNLMF
jgi:hypothetical protein